MGVFPYPGKKLDLKAEFEDQIEQAFLCGTNGMEQYVEDAAKRCETLVEGILADEDQAIEALLYFMGRERKDIPDMIKTHQYLISSAQKDKRLPK